MLRALRESVLQEVAENYCPGEVFDMLRALRERRGRGGHAEGLAGTAAEYHCGLLA